MTPRSRRAVLRSVSGAMAALAVLRASWAQEASAGDAWFRRALERAADILVSPGTDIERRAAFGRLLADEVFDFQAIARFVLGPYWDRASEAQRTAFAAALLDYLVVAYARLLRRLFAGAFDIFASRAERDGLASALGEELARAEKLVARTDWTTVVENDIVLLFVQFRPRDGDAMRTMLRVVKRARGFRVLDIWVGGISLARTHRDDVAGVVRAQSGDLERAIEVVRRKSAQLAAG